MPATPTAELHAWLVEELHALGDTPTHSVRLDALQTEASFRQFYRVGGTKTPLVLMDSPPAKEANPQFVAIAEVMRSHGIQVPRILAHNTSRGWLLLSDLGSRHFIDLYKEGDEARCLEAAVPVLDKIAAIDDPVIPPYTKDRLSEELDIFVAWLVRSACDVPLPDGMFEPVRKGLLDNAANQQTVCVHRDFHCKNLMLIAASSPDQTDPYQTDRVGVLDFQDALMGPNGYDLASLLRDCYWRFEPHLVDRTIAAVNRAAVGGTHGTIDKRSVDWLAVQRQLKAVGIFARLALRDNKTSHLRHIEGVLKQLAALCASYPELHALGQWLETSLTPAAARWVAETGHR